MILVTVGMQLGFDRLIKAMDELAPSLDVEVIAQIGKGGYQPSNMDARVSIAPSEFENLVEQCKLIVAHAGIGTVLTAQRFSKPILLVPRRYAEGEHRNDHQVATARNLQSRSGLLVAMDIADLELKIREGLAMSSSIHQTSQSVVKLKSTVAGFIENGQL